jgi:ribose transport system substrate-binding protein
MAETMLLANPDLAGIFAINDDTALGALRAVGDADLVIVGYDGTPEACDAIRRGTALKADVVQSPGLIGTRTIDAVADHLAGQPVEPVISVAVGIVDQAMLMKDG